jgi:hypothetical protein
MGVGAAYVPLYTCIDYDDGSLVTIAQMQSYDNIMVTSLGQYHERVFTPKIAIAVYNGSTFTGYGMGNTWCDCSNPGVPWYGVKWAMPLVAGSGYAAYSVQVDAVMQFRCMR